MRLRLRFIGDVDVRLRHEIRALGAWLRRWYVFPNALEIRFVHQRALIDDDGTSCALRWWHSSHGHEPVTAEIAVGTFARNLKHDGPSVAFPTVIAAVGRVLKYYDQAIRDSPQREDHADRWGDALMSAYCSDSLPPRPRKGTSSDAVFGMRRTAQIGRGTKVRRTVSRTKGRQPRGRRCVIRSG